jgi:holo-ACP synthase/triphosphoribosyl-dephospho-CoA synthase
MFSKMEQYCLQRRESAIGKKLAALALKALLYEISLSPKPGLVDKFNNGSHTDMNFLTFIDSSAAVSVWFGELVQAGFAFHEDDDTKALPVIRDIGLRMEAAMNQATGNVNTQKGIIFLMGLSLFACGRLYRKTSHFDPEIFREIIKSVCRGLVQRELKDAPQPGKSHGEEIFHKHGLSGARGEAESGFNTVFQFGLPVLTEAGSMTDMEMIRCFLAIAAHNNDTNILYRGGRAVLDTFQNLCNIALKSFNSGNFSNVEAFCERENISPGGSADLLVVSIFIWSVMQAEKRGEIPADL